MIWLTFFIKYDEIYLNINQSSYQKFYQKRGGNYVELRLKLIIFDKSVTMFPYCQPFINFQNPYFTFQNMTTIIPLNSFENFMPIPIIDYTNNLTQDPKPLENTIYQDVTTSKDENSSVDLKIKVSPDFTKSQHNSEIQKFEEQSQSSQVHSRKTKNIAKPKEKDMKKKNRSEKKDKAYVAKQYPKQEPSISCRYIQKNFQLNIINQVFSFLWSQEKSGKYVKKFFNDHIKINLFYEYVKIVRKFCKRYINKEYLKNLCDYQNHHIAYKMVVKNQQKLEYLSMKDFSRCIRHLIFIYLHELCPQAILTSRKMRKQIWKEHLIKCRLLRNFMFYNLSAEQYEQLLINNNIQLKKNDSTEESNSQN